MKTSDTWFSRITMAVDALNTATSWGVVVVCDGVRIAYDDLKQLGNADLEIVNKLKDLVDKVNDLEVEVKRLRNPIDKIINVFKPFMNNGFKQISNMLDAVLKIKVKVPTGIKYRGFGDPLKIENMVVDSVEKMYQVRSHSHKPDISGIC